MTFFDRITHNFSKLNIIQKISLIVLIICVPLVLALSVNAVNKSVAAIALLNGQETITETSPTPVPQATPEVTPTPSPSLSPSPSPTPENEPVEIFLKPSSVEEDLEVHIVDAADNMITGYPFLLTVTAKNGSYNRQWTVDDGFLRLTKISSGEYSVTIDDAEGYIIKESTIECYVEKKVDYEEVDVSDKVVDESEIDVDKEDAALTKPEETPSATPAIAAYEDRQAEKQITPAVYKYSADLVEDPIFTEKNVGYLKGPDKKYVIKVDNDGYIVDFRLAPENIQAQSDAALASLDVSALMAEAVSDSALSNTYRKNNFNIVPMTFADYSIMLLENPELPGDPTAEPTATPTAEPAATPTAEPTTTPTAEPTATPTAEPTATPTAKPTATPTAEPTATPTAEPTATPTAEPTATPTAKPSATPTAKPSASPTATPSATPTAKPSATPTATPSPKPVTYKFKNLQKATDMYENGSDGKLKASFISHYGIADSSTPEKVAYFNGWDDISRKEYYYDANGNPIKGQASIGGTVYTFDNNGKRIDSDRIAKGIDVAKWQGTIDWNAVKASGVEYAIIRAGYRGYGSGALVEDPYFRQNIQGATAAGLKVGVYVFSQAITTAEAVEEASLAINAVKGYNLQYPIYFDSEAATTNNSGRADNLSSGQRTDIANAFCQTVLNSGYKAGIYASKSWFMYNLNYNALSHYDIWLAHYTSATDFAYRYDMWQYTGSGSCPGVSGAVDLNWAYKIY